MVGVCGGGWCGPVGGGRVVCAWGVWVVGALRRGLVPVYWQTKVRDNGEGGWGGPRSGPSRPVSVVNCFWRVPLRPPLPYMDPHVAVELQRRRAIPRTDRAQRDGHEGDPITRLGWAGSCRQQARPVGAPDPWSDTAWRLGPWAPAVEPQGSTGYARSRGHGCRQDRPGKAARAGPCGGAARVAKGPGGRGKVKAAGRCFGTRFKRRVLRRLTTCGKEKPKQTRRRGVAQGKDNAGWAPPGSDSRRRRTLPAKDGGLRTQCCCGPLRRLHSANGGGQGPAIGKAPGSVKGRSCACLAGRAPLVETARAARRGEGSCQTDGRPDGIVAVVLSVVIMYSTLAPRHISCMTAHRNLFGGVRDLCVSGCAVLACVVCGGDGMRD